MEASIAIVWIACVLGAGVLLGYWCVAAWRIQRTLRVLPSITDGIGWARSTPPRASVCVVVPAHNEGALLARAIGSLKTQTHKPISIVLVLDRCTDDSEAIARDAITGDDRFELIVLDHCPEAWSGKIHAIDHAVSTSARAKGADCLLFVDADAELDPEIVAGAVALLERRELDMLSLWSRLAVRSWFDWLVQPACGIELTYQFPLLRANSRDRLRAFANGQFILFRREAYEAIGGHAAVNDQVFDDLALARRGATLGLRIGAFLGDDKLTVRMYDTWDGFVRGWKRIFTDGAKRKIARLQRAAVRNAIFGTGLPVLAIAAVALTLVPAVASFGIARWIGLAIAGLSILAWLSVLGFMYRRGGFPLWAVPLHAIGSVWSAWLLRTAARDLAQGRPVVWAGREYHLTPR